MTSITFEFDWLDPLGARGEELRATWAHLRIFANNVPVTRILDTRTNTVRDGVFVPLYPLAEWCALNWWFINYEFASPAKDNDESYMQRHCTAYARDGYAIPRLIFQSNGQSVHVNWYHDQLIAQECEFLEEGNLSVALPEFRTGISRLIEAVLERMDSVGIHGTLLHDEWASISVEDEDAQKFCIAAAQLGLDSYSVDSDTSAAIINVSSKLPESVWDEFLAVTRPATLSTDATQVANALDAIALGDSQVPVVGAARQALARGNSRSQPWDQGYFAARQLRNMWHMDGHPVKSIEHVGGLLGVGRDELRESVFDVPREAPFDGAVGVNASGHARFGLVATARPESRLFDFCRSLFELLHAKRSDPALLTRASSAAQMRNRAFAAEFLAPAEALRARVSHRVLAHEEVEALAYQFGVSTFVIGHQLQNHRIATVSSGVP